MIEYQFEANTRRCAASGRDLQPGEKFYTVLLEQEGKFCRKDYSSEAWQGPPAGTFSFWTGRIPSHAEDRRPPIDDEILLDCLERLEGETELTRLHFRYVVALLLLRRRMLKFEESNKEGDTEVLSLRCSRRRTLYRVINPQLTEVEIAATQDAVFQVLGWQTVTR
jgi:hypothetical protein